MKKALSQEAILSIYNRTSGYYNIYHHLGTYGLDEKGRKILVNSAVNSGDTVLDAGGGTGLTAVLAAQKAGPTGRVVVLDISPGMLKKAEETFKKMGLDDLITCQLGDMYQIPFPDDTFDCVLSTYSTCPLENPLNAVKEMLRVVKPGGVVGIVHSARSENRFAAWLSDKIDGLIWKFPALSLGCRNIDMSDGIRLLPVSVEINDLFGIIPFFFRILILKKQAS